MRVGAAREHVGDTPAHCPRPRPAAAPVAADSSICCFISTLLLRELSRNQVSKKTLGAQE